MCIRDRYFDFFGENVRALFPKDSAPPARALMVVVFPVYFGLALLKSVKSIAPYAALATALIFGAIFVVLGEALQQIHSLRDEPRGFAAAKPSTLPLFFGTVVCGGSAEIVSAVSALILLKLV